jgi:shikimate 5-dehydrogenase
MTLASTSKVDLDLEGTTPGGAANVGVMGAGAVGRACVLSMLQRGSCREIVLVNRTRERAAGVATDMGYGRPLSVPVAHTDGEDAMVIGEHGTSPGEAPAGARSAPHHSAV